MTSSELLRLALAYAQATGLELSTVSRKACGKDNNKSLARLSRGHGINAATVERAASWFAENWPDDAPWPEGVDSREREARRKAA